MDSAENLSRTEREFRSLFRACTGQPCPDAAWTLYARAASGQAPPLPAPRWIAESPFWLTLFEPLPGRSPAFDARRRAVLQLAESLPSTTRQFHAGAATGRARAWAGLIGAGLAEGLKLPVRVVAGYLFW